MANEGYLLAAEIARDDEFMDEIKRLSNSFGIDLIELNINNPDSSEIIYPARQKELVDIETMNKISQINPDFKEFIKKIRKEKYNKICNIDELLKLK